MEQIQRTQGIQKKSVEDALADYAKTGKTRHELLLKVSQARKINKVCGFEAIAPWEVGELDDEWCALFDGLYEIEAKKAESEKQKAEGSRQFEAVLARRRAENQSYRKY